MHIILKILILFIFAQLLGLFAGTVILQDMGSNPYVQEMVITSDKGDLTNLVFMFLYILLGSVLMILLIRLYKGELLFKLIDIIIISASSSIVFYSVFRQLFFYEQSMLFGIALGLLLAALKQLYPLFKNMSVVLASAGVAVVFGVSLETSLIIIFMVLLSVYDYLAVFKTKHMVEMANFMIKKDLAFTVTASRKVRGKQEGRLDLGSGDLVAPAMLAVSALAISATASIMVIAGSTISLMVFLLHISKRKVILPALPPIAFGAIAFFFLGMVFGFY